MSSELVAATIVIIDMQNEKAKTKKQSNKKKETARNLDETPIAILNYISGFWLLLNELRLAEERFQIIFSSFFTVFFYIISFIRKFILFMQTLFLPVSVGWTSIHLTPELLYSTSCRK